MDMKVWEIILVSAVVLIALGARMYFRAKHLSQRSRVALSFVALGLMGVTCLRSNEFGWAPYCMLGFGAFVLIASLLFLRNFTKSSSEDSSVKGSG